MHSLSSSICAKPHLSSCRETEKPKSTVGYSFKNVALSIDDLRIHFVQLVEASKYEFIFRKSIVRSLGLRLWIQHILIFLLVIIDKAAEEVGQKAKEKVGMAEEEDKRKVVDEFARVHLSESPKAPSSKEDDVHEPKRSESPEPKESEHQEPQQQQQSSQPVGPAQP